MVRAQKIHKRIERSFGEELCAVPFAFTTRRPPFVRIRRLIENFA